LRLSLSKILLLKLKLKFFFRETKTYITMGNMVVEEICLI